MKGIRTTHYLPYPPEEVWAVLADFCHYSEWNPLNIAAEGEARTGAHVPMRFIDAGGGKGRILAQTVAVTACDPPRRLEWVGRIPLLFTGRHFFELEDDAGGTRLLHGEDLSGIIPMLFSAERVRRQKAAYEEMNLALERRVGAVTSR